MIHWEEMSIKYNIFFRACDKVESVHKDKRPFGLNKLEIIKISFYSLCQENIDEMKQKGIW